MHDGYEIRSLHIMPLKMRAHLKSYGGQNKWMYFLIQDDDLLENIILFGIKSAPIIKKEFDSDPVYINFFLENQNKILR